MATHKPTLRYFLGILGQAGDVRDRLGGDALTELLRFPHPGAFAGLDAASFARLTAPLNDDDLAALRLALLPAALLCKEQVPEHVDAWLDAQLRPRDMQLPFATWKELSDWEWRLVRVLVAGQDDATQRTLLAGHGQEPAAPWSENLATLDEAAWRQVRLAADLAARHCACDANRFTCLPLVPPQARPIEGASLGLPVFLGMLSAAKGQQQERDQLRATGELDENGKVRPVTRVQEKAQAAWDQGASGFLLPGDGDKPAYPPEGKELLYVYHADTAWDIWHYGQEARRNRLLLLLNEKANPVHFVRHMLHKECPPGIVEWARQHKELLGQILGDCIDQEDSGELKDHFDTLADFFRGKYDQAQLDLARIVMEAIPEDAYERLRELGHNSALFSFCEARVKHYTAQGDVEQERYWLDEMKRHVKEQDQAMDYAVKLIPFHHNNFHFGLDIEEMIPSPEIRAIIAAKRQGSGRFKDRRVAGYYGALAQNNAFAGPKHLEQTRKFVRLALEQGNDRAMNYRVLALLDAGRLKQTRAALRDYLGQKGIRITFERSLLEEKGYAFKLHVMTRFAVEGGEVEGLVVEELWEHARQLRERHFPWQLILYHLGLLASNTEMKKELLLESARACLKDKSRMTIIALALLPLSALALHGLGDESWLQDQVRRVLKVLRQLNKKHFAPVLEAGDWRDALRLAHEQRACLFPFSYR